MPKSCRLEVSELTDIPRESFCAKDLEFVDSLVGQYKRRGFLSYSQRRWVSVLTDRGADCAKKKSWQRPHYLYAIESGDAVKVGFSCDPYARLRNLQTGHASKLILRRKIEVGDKRSAMVAEKRLHQHLQRFHIRGEWYDLKCLETKKEWKWRK